MEEINRVYRSSVSRIIHVCVFMHTRQTFKAHGPRSKREHSCTGATAILPPLSSCIISIGNSFIGSSFVCPLGVSTHSDLWIKYCSVTISVCTKERERENETSYTLVSWYTRGLVLHTYIYSLYAYTRICMHLYNSPDL